MQSPFARSADLAPRSRARRPVRLSRLTDLRRRIGQHPLFRTRPDQSRRRARAVVACIYDYGDAGRSC